MPPTPTYVRPVTSLPLEEYLAHYLPGSTILRTEVLQTTVIAENVLIRSAWEEERICLLLPQAVPLDAVLNLLRRYFTAQKWRHSIIHQEDAHCLAGDVSLNRLIRCNLTAHLRLCGTGEDSVILHVDLVPA